MFRTNRQWKRSSTILRSSSVSDCDSVYVMVEAPVEAPIFHVELLLGSKISTPKRYLVSSLAIVLQIVGDPRVKDCRIAIQNFSEISDGYILSNIDEILSFEDLDGFTNLVYRCCDGIDYVDGVGQTESAANENMLSLWKSEQRKKTSL